VEDVKQSLKKVNRLGSSVWDLFEKGKDKKTAKLAYQLMLPWISDPNLFSFDSEFFY